MLYPSLVLNIVIVSGLAILFNLIALIALFCLRKGRSIRDNPSLIPLLCLLLIDFGLSGLLLVPFYSFTSTAPEEPFFSWTTCQIYGGLDMALSLSQFLLACLIAFDRYVASLAPKWGQWRRHSNYFKVIVISVGAACLWSLVPVFGYGNYDTFLDGHFCSLDWKQGDIDSSLEVAEQAHHYIGFLTATCLVFFLIPVCIASALYYSIIDHVDRINNADVREEGAAAAGHGCTWAPKDHIAKIGLGCLLSSTLPYLAYSIVCLNPMKSDFKQPSYVVAPAVISRLTTVFNPLLYIFLNPEIIPIDQLVAKRQARRRPPPKTYQTIGLMIRPLTNVPGVSNALLTPTIPRRQLPQIPLHLASPSKRPENSVFYGETYPML